MSKNDSVQQMMSNRAISVVMLVLPPTLMMISYHYVPSLVMWLSYSWNFLSIIQLLFSIMMVVNVYGDLEFHVPFFVWLFIPVVIVLQLTAVWAYFLGIV